MTVWAIRQKSTGGYLPQGGTWHTKDEPTARGVPRLFRERRFAVLALQWWLAGIAYTRHYRDDWGGGDLVVEHQWNRQADDMEIVCLQLCGGEASPRGAREG
jgi:hypothetical protein